MTTMQERVLRRIQAIAESRGLIYAVQMDYSNQGTIYIQDDFTPVVSIAFKVTNTHASFDFGLNGEEMKQTHPRPAEPNYHSLHFAEGDKLAALFARVEEVCNRPAARTPEEES